jgi:cytochrome oxidase Cu insertion factor (SCO1/SenC/PrrC family)
MLAAAAVLAALSLAACGGDDDEAGLAVGDDAPAFSLPAAGGGQISLDDFRDQPVLLYFHMADG